MIDDDNLGWVDVDITGGGNDGAKVWEGKMALKYSRNPSRYADSRYADRLEVMVQENEVGHAGRGWIINEIWPII